MSAEGHDCGGDGDGDHDGRDVGAGRDGGGGGDQGLGNDCGVDRQGVEHQGHFALLHRCLQV